MEMPKVFFIPILQEKHGNVWKKGRMTKKIKLYLPTKETIHTLKEMEFYC